MRLAISATVLLALVAALPAGAAAQWRVPADAAPATRTAASSEPAAQLRLTPVTEGAAESRQGAMLGGGLVGGVAGGLVGLAWGLTGDDLGSAYVGTVTGIAAGMSVGVHHGNRKQGSLALGLLGSVGWSLVLAGFAAQQEAVPLLAAAPLGSLLVSMAVEQWTSRRR